MPLMPLQRAIAVSTTQCTLILPALLPAAPPVAVLIANMIGAPIAAGLLAMDGVGGLK